MGSGIGYKGGMILRIAQNLLWRAYQIVLFGTAIGVNACLEFEYGWVWAFPLGFGAAWFGTILTLKISDRLRRPARLLLSSLTAIVALPESRPFERLDR